MFAKVHIHNAHVYMYIVPMYSTSNMLQYPCGMVRVCTMKMHGLPRIIGIFPPMISMDTVKKFYAAALRDTLLRFTGIEFTVINS